MYKYIRMVLTQNRDCTQLSVFYQAALFGSASEHH